MNIYDFTDMNELNKNVAFGYGCMAYYTSETCGYKGSTLVETGCTTDYDESEVKYVVDAWKNAKAPEARLSRLLTYEELSEYVETKQICTGSCYETIGLKYDWMYDINYRYWLGTSYTDLSSRVWDVNNSGVFNGNTVYNNNGVVRPVITIAKSSLQ